MRVIVIPKHPGVVLEGGRSVAKESLAWNYRLSWPCGREGKEKCESLRGWGTECR